ncbi:Major capsid protein precursor (GpN) [Escherichia coli]|uniref:P2 family phage major capsid protein n=1 Tax=Escherichia coli TaxID=562 RepID=UPI0006A48359|nr:P2 family phage major capsid protein [Escherichia coli]CTZ98307.1 Major capsid protein precursor (GpN) [Escherichia coli]
MSMVARTEPRPAEDDITDTDDGDTRISAGAFWPDIVLRELRLAVRLPGRVTTSRLLHTAGQLILSSRTIGGLGVFLAPFFPDATMLITSFNNLSIYWQKGSMRRLMKDEPEYNRIATYQSINDAYVVEDYGKCAMVTGLKFADS